MNPRTIAVFAILTLAGLVSFFLVWPKIGEVNSLRNKLSKQREEGLLARSRFETTQQAIAQFQSLPKKDRDLVDSAFPDAVDLPNLFVLVDALISRSGLVGEDIHISVTPRSNIQQAQPITQATAAVAPRFLSTVPSSPFGETDITFTAVGSYESLKIFLDAIEKSLKIFDLQTVTLEASEKSEQVHGGFKFGVTLKTYYND